MAYQRYRTYPGLMASTTDERRTEGVEFIHEDGLVTARDVESGLAGSGKTKAEALTTLAEVIEHHEGGGEPIEDEAAVLEETGLDPDGIAASRVEYEELPDFLR